MVCNGCNCLKWEYAKQKVSENVTQLIKILKIKNLMYVFIKNVFIKLNNIYKKKVYIYIICFLFYYYYNYYYYYLYLLLFFILMFLWNVI